MVDGTSNLFVQILGPKAGHVWLVYGVQSLPVGAPFIVDSVFEIEPMPRGPFQHDSSDPEANRQALGNEPISLAYDPINERMYVTNSFDNTASVINFC